MNVKRSSRVVISSILFILIISTCNFHQLGRQKSIKHIDYTIPSDSQVPVSQLPGRLKILAEYQAGDPPYLDGMIDEPFWGNNWDIIRFKPYKMTFMVKHDTISLYFAIKWEKHERCTYASRDYDELSFYFEDDGIYPDGVLGANASNEDHKYVGASFGEGIDKKLNDAHYENGVGWPVDAWGQGSYPSSCGYYGAKIVGTQWNFEASIPLNSGDIEDINVTSSEILGFALFLYYCLPTVAKLDPFPKEVWRVSDSSNWADLLIIFPDDQQINEKPESIVSYNTNIPKSDPSSINLTLTSDLLGGEYFVLKNDTLVKAGVWLDNDPFVVAIDTNRTGTLRYMIYFWDNGFNYGIPIECIISILNPISGYDLGWLFLMLCGTSLILVSIRLVLSKKK